jgi:hypothetical protein
LTNVDLHTIFNEAINAGYVDRSAYPFGQSKDGKYEIPEAEGRKINRARSVHEYSPANNPPVDTNSPDASALRLRSTPFHFADNESIW